MKREDLITLGNKIIESELPEEEIDKLIGIFNSNVAHPSGANLFFYPENYNARRDNISDYQPTVEDVVDLCLSYKPVEL